MIRSNATGIRKKAMKIPGFLLVFTAMVSLPAHGQGRKEFKEKFLEAEYFFLKDHYDEAAYYYSELLKMDPENNNLHFLTGACYLSIYGQKRKAIPHLEKAIRKISVGYREGSYREKEAPREALFALARAYHIDNQFDKALKLYKQYRDVMVMRSYAQMDYVDKMIRSCKLAGEMVKEPIDLEYSNPGNIINYSGTNYNAVVSDDGRIMIYMAKKPFYAAIMMSEKVRGFWSEPVVLNPQVGSDGNLMVTGISRNGKELYLASDDPVNGDIYVSRFLDGKWKKAVPLGKNINSEYNETHASLSGDGQTLYFTSDRPGGQGGLDLYYSRLSNDGEWSGARNMGKTINTRYNEESPFTTRDGEILYFSSEGHAGMGGYDIFYSTRLPSNRWSSPANIGYPLSTTDDDLFFVPHENGETAYFSTILPETETRNIYAIRLTTDEKTEHITLYGKIILSDNIKVLDQSFRATIIDAEKKDTIASIQPDTLAGTFEKELKPGMYRILASGSGYHPAFKEVRILPGQRQNGIRLDIGMVPEEVESGEYLVVKSIMFDFDEYDLSGDAIYEMEKLYQIMKKYPELYIEAIGHTDAIGSEEYNLKLSGLRARSVVNYLVNKGIDPERFVSKGVGESRNIARNITPSGKDLPEGRRLNRHVDIKILNQEKKNIVIQDILVPEHLRPGNDLKYTVMLSTSGKKIRDLPGEIHGQAIKLTETDHACIYTAGYFTRKTDAVRLLNQVIDEGYPDAVILEQNELDDLIRMKSSVSRPSSAGLLTIQLMALKNPVETEYFKDLEKVRVFHCRDGYHRYVHGRYKDLEEAREALSGIFDLGYRDAFIMDLSRFSQIAEGTKTAGKSKATDQTPGYTIQFSATKVRARPGKFSDIGDVQVTRGDDGFFRYTTGRFQNRYDAQKRLAEIHRLGYTDVFLRKTGQVE